MYLDHNAGGRVRPEVAEALSGWLREDAGNPSSLHSHGRRARRALEQARVEVAALVGARPPEVTFTSGGTEANNLAIRGILAPTGSTTNVPTRNVVSTSIEHASVLAAIRAHGQNGVETRVLESDGQARVSPERVAAAVDAHTALVSVGWANGEVGTIQPIAEILDAVRRANPATRFHSDAVQAVGQLEVDVHSVDVDLLSLSGHKLGAPSGVGALIVRRQTELDPQLVGGPQERERRAGTENLLGIVGLGCAARLVAAEKAAYAMRAATIKSEILAVLQSRGVAFVRLGARSALPATLALSFEGLRGDALAAALDLRGVAVSTGSACAAGSPEPSHVLRAMGMDEDGARSGLRLSFGPEIALEQARAAAGIVADVVTAARSRRAKRSSGGIHNAA